MPIQVTCPGCHTRFNVADQHAGKTGACPKCKGPIEIPKLSDEVVIHAPELEAGAVDSKGRSVLKPIARKQAKFQVNTFVAVAGSALLSLAIAWLIGRSDLSDQATFWVLTVGAILLGPPIAYLGYTFLRDEELGTYQGMSLLLRSLCCGGVYALLWGVYIFVAVQLFGSDFITEGLGMEHLTGLSILIGAIGAVGAGAAYVCFDLELLTGFFHYALYLLITIGLRAVMDLPFVPGM